MSMEKKSILFENMMYCLESMTPEETLCLLKEYDISLEQIEKYQTSLSKVDNIKIGKKLSKLHIENNLMKTYVVKPKEIQAVQLADGNFKQVYNNTQAPDLFLFAQVGDYIVKSEDGFKLYPMTSFEEQYMIKEGE